MFFPSHESYGAVQHAKKNQLNYRVFHGESIQSKPLYLLALNNIYLQNRSAILLFRT